MCSVSECDVVLARPLTSDGPMLPECGQLSGCTQKSRVQAIEKLGEEVADSSRREQALEDILEHEMQLLDSLKGGEALAQHLEDQYLEALCTIISDARPSEQMAAAMASVRANVVEYRKLLEAAAAAEQEKAK